MFFAMMKVHNPLKHLCEVEFSVFLSRFAELTLWRVLHGLNNPGIQHPFNHPNTINDYLIRGIV